jgi:hypothetical protein
VPAAEGSAETGEVAEAGAAATDVVTETTNGNPAAETAELGSTTRSCRRRCAFPLPPEAAAEPPWNRSRLLRLIRFRKEKHNETNFRYRVIETESMTTQIKFESMSWPASSKSKQAIIDLCLAYVAEKKTASS